MAEWHHRKALMAVAAQALKHTVEQAEIHMAFEPIVDRLWVYGERDFSWYDTPMYAYSCVNCFCDFAKGYAQNAAKWIGENVRENAKIIDFCSGIGASSMIMQTMLPGHSVWAHNLPGSGAQDKVREALQLVVPDRVTQGTASLESLATTFRSSLEVFCAFDVLEHFERPFEVIDVIEQAGAYVLIEASSFSEADDYGHWPTYTFPANDPTRECVVDRKQAGREFAKEMRWRGWKDEKDTGFWNGRPRVWRR